jgi:hypothetical protein
MSYSSKILQIADDLLFIYKGASPNINIEIHIQHKDRIASGLLLSHTTAVLEICLTAHYWGDYY